MPSVSLNLSPPTSFCLNVPPAEAVPNQAAGLSAGSRSPVHTSLGIPHPLALAQVQGFPLLVTLSETFLSFFSKQNL